MPQPARPPGNGAASIMSPPPAHWIQSHIPAQEVELLAAPLIVRRPEDVTADRQEVLAEITGAAGGMEHDRGAMGHGAPVGCPSSC